jgi:hypothetical protein
MQTLLLLNINPGLEEDLVDYLLAKDFIDGFTSYTVYGHGIHSDMSLTEQVSGRRKRLQVEAILEKENVDELLAGLKQNVGTDIVYWEQSISNKGRID